MRPPKAAARPLSDSNRAAACAGVSFGLGVFGFVTPDKVVCVGVIKLIEKMGLPKSATVPNLTAGPNKLWITSFDERSEINLTV